MISKLELQEYAKARQFTLGQAEKDFFQNVILFVLYQEYGKELVFKGGTALAKCYGLRRFSEDLDFTATREIDLEKTLSVGLNRLGIIFELHGSRVLIRGPLYAGMKQSLCSIRIDISTREKIMLSPKIITIRTLTAALPNFDVIAMDLQEIFAEKVRAIMTREQARDLYDLFMIQEAVASTTLIEEKLAFYKKKFTKKEFQQAVKRKKRIWEKELEHLINQVPDFPSVETAVTKTINHVK